MSKVRVEIEKHTLWSNALMTLQPVITNQSKTFVPLRIAIDLLLPIKALTKFSIALMVNTFLSDQPTALWLS